MVFDIHSYLPRVDLIAQVLASREDVRSYATYSTEYGIILSPKKMPSSHPGHAKIIGTVCPIADLRSTQSLQSHSPPDGVLPLRHR